ncbi:MAG: hypothetical protein K9G30_09435 [Parvibaculum sp.]|nr:hypothetical protein [Parvibaculum sp.]
MAIAEAVPLLSREDAAAAGMILAWHSAQTPDRPAIISGQGNRTFAELNAKANRLVRAIRNACWQGEKKI